MFSLFKNKPELQESSMNFDMENLEPFLQRVASLISEGFGQAEVSQIVGNAQAMVIDQEKSQEFTIQFDGKQSPFGGTIVMDDIDAPDAYFFSPPDLAIKIDEQMDKFCEELDI